MTENPDQKKNQPKAKRGVLRRVVPVLALFAVILVIAAVALWPLFLMKLKDALSKELSAKTGMTVRINDLELRWPDRIMILDAECCDSQNRMKLNFGEISIYKHILTVFRDPASVDEVKIDNMKVTIRDDGSFFKTGEQSQSGAKGSFDWEHFNCPVKLLNVKSCRLDYSREDSDISVQAVIQEARADFLNGAAGRNFLTGKDDLLEPGFRNFLCSMNLTLKGNAQSVRIAEANLENGALSFESHLGRMKLDFQGTLNEGPVTATLDAVLDKDDLPWSLRVKGEDIAFRQNLVKWTQFAIPLFRPTTEADKKMREENRIAKGNFELNLSGQTPRRLLLQSPIEGKGSVRLSEAIVEYPEPLRIIGSMMGESWSMYPMGKLQSDFHIGNGILAYDEVILYSPANKKEIGVSGTVSLRNDYPVQFRLSFYSLGRKMVKDSKLALLLDDQNVLRVGVKGNVAEGKYEPDLGEMVEDTFENLLEEILGQTIFKKKK